MTDAEKWENIRDAWILYCKRGAGSFDWDYDSRPLMRELTGEDPFQWMLGESV